MATPPGAAASQRPATLTPAIIILGADALLAARPSSPAQLVNACYAGGYSAVIPSSWGDELVAARYLREMASRGQGPVVLCACPRVAERMRRVESLVPQLLSVVPPPVAAARYLRARAGRHGVHITYVGDCPGGADPAIDRHATPGALLRSLAKRGIDLATQATEVEERLLRDARRFYSLPGGAPAPNWLYVEKRGYTLVEPSARDFLAEVAYRVAKRERRVVDLAPRLGCACSGAVVGQSWPEARDKVAALEPPRAVHEVLDHDVPVDLSVPLEPWTGSAHEGDPTVPISLEALAAMYDASTKASTVRTLPPPPVPLRRRTSGEKAAEPSTPARLAPGTAAASPAAVSPGVASPALAQGGPSPVDRSAAGATSTRGERPSPPAGTTGTGATPPSDDVGAAARALTAEAGAVRSGETEVSTDRGAEAPSDVDTTDGDWEISEPRRLRLAQVLFVGLCLLFAAAVTGMVGVLLLGGNPFVRTAPAPRSSTTAGPAPATDTAVLRDTAARDADTTGDTTATDTTTLDTTSAPGLPPAMDLPRLPIGPTSVAGATRRHLSPLVGADAGHAPRGVPVNPAPVYTPGAAPMPRATEGSGQRLPATSSPAAPNSPAVPDAGSEHTSSAELVAIRAEIARRRQRVDSLRHVLDSLAKKAVLADSR